MEQEKLEQRVREIFEEQGFEVSKSGKRLKVENGVEKDVAVFSSDNFSAQEAVESTGGEDIIFVDGELEPVREELEIDVSVVREDEGPDYDLPSYELIGDIAVINDLAGRSEKETVEGILHHHPRVETVLLKEEGLGGEFRVGDYRILHGEETETTHTEFGCRYRVDPTKVYFSERFATERKRIVDQVEDGEEVLVMFAGVGPFAVLAAREAEPGKVVAVEKNPVAAEYLVENVELNGVEGIVEAVEGDVRNALEDWGEFDRVVMPLPGLANEYLELAFIHTSTGGVIHYYRFVEDGNRDKIEKEVASAAAKAGRKYEITDSVVTGEKGPGVSRVCADIKIK